MRFLPLKRSRENANAARVITIIISPVVITVKISVLKKYVYNEDTLNEALKLIKEKKYTYTLKNPKEKSLTRKIWINHIYSKDKKIYKKYFPPKGDQNGI